MKPEESNGELGSSSPNSYSDLEEDESYYSSDGQEEMEMVEMGEDRLSDLPDAILHHILSFFLDTRLVIPTALLSRRWRYVWTSLPSLSFDRDTFKAIEAYSPNRRDFVDFVNQVLSKRNNNADIHSFHLHWGSGVCRQSHIDSWLGYVMSRNVQELDLQIATKHRYLYFPPSLYTSMSLSLEFDFNMGYKSDPGIIPLPESESIDLPLLKNLSLTLADDIGNELLDMYFSGCPLLEKLTLIGCYLDDHKNLDISAPQLKHLKLGIFDKNVWDTRKARKIRISTPNLVSLSCSDYVSHDFCFENLSSLEVASMEMVSPESDYYYEQEGDGPPFTKEDTNRMVKCLKELYNVKSLTLNYTFLEVISAATEISTIPFLNLKYLKLITWIGEAHLPPISYLLQNSPNVETLVFELLSYSETANAEDYWEQLSLPNLKFIEIREFQGRYDHDLDFLKVILKKAVGLKKLSVFIWQSSEVSEEKIKSYREKLVTFPCASKDVIIEFREPEEIDENSFESSLAIMSFLFGG